VAITAEYELFTPHGWLKGTASGEGPENARDLVAATLAELQSCEYRVVRADWGTDEWDALDLEYSQSLVNWKAANILLDILSGERVVITDDEIEKVRITRGCFRCNN